MTPSLAPASSRRAITEILREVARHRTFLLTGHERPDGDTVGCELAFASFLRRKKKTVTVANTRPIPEYLRFLPGAESALVTPRVEGRFDCILVFESSGFDRTGNIAGPAQAKVVINIDHHAHFNRFGHINLIDPNASSNAEQVFYILRQAKHKINPGEAAALYAGLVTDTGRFQQENTRPASHWVSAELLKCGLDVAEVSRRIFATRPVSTLHLLGRALNSLRLLYGDRLAVMTLAAGDFAATGAGEDDIEDVVNHGLMPPTVEAVLFAREVEGGLVKISLRGKGRLDLCAFAVSLGGGGHKNAAGATLPGPLNKTVERLTESLGGLLP